MKQGSYLRYHPEFVDGMVKNNWLGSKTGQGFYKKEKVDGVNQFYALDLKTLGIQAISKSKIRLAGNHQGG
jgi:3-hydroxyacyl-CoA dehydrogenase